MKPPSGRSAKTDDSPMFAPGFIRSISIVEERVKSRKRYPYSIPAISGMTTLELDPKVTFLVGENGSGKSTLIEGIAVAAGFNAEGGSKNFSFATRRSESGLHNALQVKRGIRREKDGFFLRAESLYNVASDIEKQEEDLKKYGFASVPFGSYGGISLHEQSHGESFLALANHRFRGEGFYVLDEPESALSPARQLALLQILHHQVEQRGSQFLIATHSPILMAYPDATIYHMGASGIEKIAYEETEHYQITRDFLHNPKTYLHHLLQEPET